MSGRPFTIDAPEWIGSMPAGETITRAEAVGSLEPKRPMPKLDFVYVKETGWNVLVLYLVTWVRTTQGWRAFGMRSSSRTAR
jgi:hypothetical protein